MVNADKSLKTRGRPDEAHEMLGRQLFRLREACKISTAAAARDIGCSSAKISRIERGRCKVKEDDLYRLLDLYQATDLPQRHALLEFAGRLNNRQWWDTYGEVVDSWFRSYLVLESIAQLIRTYEVRFVPGLLQTPAYAEAVVRLHHTNDDEVQRRVQVRLRRQRTVLDRGTPRLWAVVDQAALEEAALPGGITSPTVMREQIKFLIDAIEQPNVVVQVLPAGAGARSGVANSFSLLRLRPKGLPEVAYLEHIGDALFLDHPDKADRYASAMSRLTIAAGRPQDAAETLKKALAATLM